MNSIALGTTSFGSRVQAQTGSGSRSVQAPPGCDRPSEGEGTRGSNFLDCFAAQVEKCSAPAPEQEPPVSAQPDPETQEEAQGPDRLMGDANGFLLPEGSGCADPASETPGTGKTGPGDRKEFVRLENGRVSFPSANNIESSQDCVISSTEPSLATQGLGVSRGSGELGSGLDEVLQRALENPLSEDPHQASGTGAKACQEQKGPSPDSEPCVGKNDRVHENLRDVDIPDLLEPRDAAMGEDSSETEAPPMPLERGSLRSAETALREVDFADLLEPWRAEMGEDSPKTGGSAMPLERGSLRSAETVFREVLSGSKEDPLQPLTTRVPKTGATSVSSGGASPDVGAGIGLPGEREAGALPQEGRTPGFVSSGHLSNLPRAEPFFSSFHPESRAALEILQTQVRLSIRDESLGRMEWHLLVGGGKVTAEAVVDSARLQEVIQSQEDVLRGRLRDLGLQVDAFEVSVDQGSRDFSPPPGDQDMGVQEPLLKAALADRNPGRSDASPVRRKSHEVDVYI